MALLKKFNVIKYGNNIRTNTTNTGIVINPSTDKTIWINDSPHEYNSLFPVFDKKNIALKNMGVKGDLGFVESAIVAKGPMILCGQDTSHNSIYFGTKQDSYMLKNRDSNLEDSNILSRTSRTYSFQDSNNNNFHIVLFYTTHNTAYTGFSATNYIFIEGDDFSNPNSVATGSLSVGSFNTTETHQSGLGIIHVDTTNKYIYFASRGTGSSNSNYRDQGYQNQVLRSSYTTVVDDNSLSISTPTAVLTPNTTVSTEKHMESNNFYYCGKNNDNTLMFMEFIETNTVRATQQNAVRSASILTAESYNTSTNVTSTVATLTTSNLTDATVAANILVRPRPSQFYNSNIVGEDHVYYAYYPCVNSSNEMSFILVTWDKSANTNAGSVSISNCTMTYGSGTVTDYIGYHALGTTDDTMSTRSNLFITNNGSNYYLHYLPSYGNPTNLAKQSAAARNLVTYTIDSTDWSSLTYHSSIQVDSLEFIHLNNNREKIAIISSASCKVYTWNNGWIQTASEGGNFIGICQDSNGRLFGIDGSVNIANENADADDSSYYSIENRVKLITDAAPNTVTIDFTNEDLTYSGSNITTNITVNAYDSSSTRIAKSVILKIDGPNAQFTSNSTKTLTTTTSSSSDTTIGLTITGLGPITLSGSFSI